MIENILLDFDGTIADSFEAVYDAVSYVLRELHGSPITKEVLRPMLGTPTRKILSKLLDSPDQVDTALLHFRSRYADIEASMLRLYPGIEDVLVALRAEQTRIFVCTVRPRISAERALAHLGIRHLVDKVYGAELDGAFENKAELIAHMLKVEQFSATSALMVGDRATDVLSAASHRIHTIAVTWGYASYEELRSAGAALLCARVGQLPDAIRAGSRVLDLA